MEKSNKLTDLSDDPDFFDRVKESIDKDLSTMKKIVDNVNQMRVEASYLESDLMTIIDAKTWENVSQLIGLTTADIMDVSFKNEQ